MPFLGVTQSVFCSGKVRSQYSSALSIQKKAGNIWHPRIEAIDEISVKLMQLMCDEPTMSLSDQRYNAYKEQIMKGTLRPERLPQSSSDPFQHGRRMFTQLREWVLLNVNLTIGPYRYGWGLSDKEAGYYPVYNAGP